MIYCNEQVLLKCLQSWASVVFSTQSLSESAFLSYFINLFLLRNNGEFWYKCIHHCTWKFVYNRPVTVRYPTDLLQRRQGTVRCRTVPGWAPADVFIFRRRTAPVRYVTTQEKILKIVRCPGDYQIRRWCAHRWNRPMSVLFVTIALHIISKSVWHACASLFPLFNTWIQINFVTFSYWPIYIECFICYWSVTYTLILPITRKANHKRCLFTFYKD